MALKIRYVDKEGVKRGRVPAKRTVRHMGGKWIVTDKTDRGWDLYIRETADGNDIPEPFRTQAYEQRNECFGVLVLPLEVLTP